MASSVPIIIEILACFLLSTSLLHRYSDMVNHNIIIVVGVFISWFFSFMVIFLLPVDLTSTAYRQCVLDHQTVITTTTTPVSVNNSTTILPFNKTLDQTFAPIPQNSLASSLNATHQALIHSYIASQTNNITNPCLMPWNYLSDGVLLKLWRFIYWTSQALTWLILPVMQSYSMCGEFTTLDRFKSALRSNLIYYSSIGAIFTFFLIYVIIRTGLDFSSLKVIVISSSNTWGLFLLVILLGYGLVELPRFLIHRSKYYQSLNRQYFRVGKLNAEKCEAEEKLDDVLEEVHQIYSSLGEDEHNPFRGYLAIIVNRCPPDWKRRSNVFRRQQVTSSAAQDIDGTKIQSCDLQTLIRLHRKIIKAVHYHRQISCRWSHLIEEVIEWEDVVTNLIENQGPLSSRHFKSTLPKERSLIHSLYTSKVEYIWKCLVKIWLFRTVGYITAIFSVAVVWSEMAFPMSFLTPKLSIFANFIDHFQSSQQYFNLEVSWISIAIYKLISNPIND